MIREYLGFSKFDSDSKLNDFMHLQEGLSSADPISPDSIMVDIEGLHAGPTRNYTRYMESALKSSIKSWTHPYEKPLIMHHNEKDGKIIGRIKSVHYSDINTRSGTGALVFTANVPDEEGMKQIKDGRLTTVSVGIIGHDVRCSICNHDIASFGMCEHERGEVYDGEICYWDVYEMEGKELSYVIVPSDIYAKNIRIYKPERNSSQIKESVNLTEGVSALNLTEAEIKKLQDDLKTYKENNEKLEKELKEAKDELKTAQDELKALKDSDPEIEKIKEEKEGLEQKLKDAQDKLKEAQDKLKDIEGELKEEKALRESLESKAIEQNSETKQALAENYALLRKLAGKPELSIESIQERSQESLIDAIKDLKEEFGGKIDIATIRPVNDPTITESIEPKGNKEKKASNIDLEESLEQLFSDIAGKHLYK